MRERIVEVMLNEKHFLFCKCAQRRKPKNEDLGDECLKMCLSPLAQCEM
jgi:hypothetical protein